MYSICYKVVAFTLQMYYQNIFKELIKKESFKIVKLMNFCFITLFK